MKSPQWAIAVVPLLAFIPCAHADSFDLTRVTTLFGCSTCENPFPTGINVAVTLLGPGTNIQAVDGFECLDAWCQPTQFGFAPGTSLFPNMGSFFQSEIDTAIVGGVTFNTNEFVALGLAINSLGGPFRLPHPTGNLSDFVRCVPARASGPISASGDTTAGSFVSNILIVPTETGRFCTTWVFDTTGWFLAEGKFTVSAVPEPGTLSLTGLGIVLLAMWKRMRQVRVGECLDTRNPTRM